MPEEYHPVKYRIEIYENALGGDPTNVFHATEPFLSIHAGDYISHLLLYSPPLADMDGKILRVKAVQHLICDIKDAHVSHSLSVCVEVVPRPDGI